MEQDIQMKGYAISVTCRCPQVTNMQSLSQIWSAKYEEGETGKSQG
jgi:hypothetical protein